MPTFVLELRFDKDNERRLEIRPAHREFLGKLHDEGVLVMAGPLADDTGAIQIFRADSLESLEETIAEDPNYVEDVVSRVSLREWTPILP